MESYAEFHTTQLRLSYSFGFPRNGIKAANQESSDQH